MDIHKPKPWHGVREFLKEYVIIVVGVLTALGGEQVVEWAHRQSEVAEAREALHAELAANGRTGRFVGVEVGCLAEQLDAYDAWAKGGPHPGEIRGVFPAFASSTWDIVKSGAVPHMPLKERLAYSRYFDSVGNSGYGIETSRNIYLRLNGLSKHDGLSPEEVRRLVEDLSQARLIGRVRAINAAGLVDAANALGVSPAPYTDSGKATLTRVCGRPFNG